MRRQNRIAAILLLTPIVGLFGRSVVADGVPFEVLGLMMKTEAGSADTRGAMSVVRVDTPPGSGPPAHVHHRDDELFIVLEGQYRFWLEGKPATDAGAGDVVFMPKNVAHQYLNVGSEPGSHYFVTVPGGLDELFAEIHAGNLSVPKDRGKLIELSRKYGIEYVPPLAPK